MKNLLFLTLILANACSHVPQKPTSRYPASLSSLDLKILETEKLLDKLQKVQRAPAPTVMLDYIDSGLDRSKKHYEINAEILSNTPFSISRAEVLVENKSFSPVPIVHEQGRAYIKHKASTALKLHNTKIRIYFSDNSFTDNDLVCTRAGECT